MNLTYTLAAVETRIAFTVVNIGFTLSTGKACLTDTGKIIDLVDAGRIISARVTFALVNFRLAVSACNEIRISFTATICFGRTKPLSSVL